MNPNTQVQELQLIRMPEVKRVTGVSRPTIYRLIEKGEFPKPVRQGRTSAWPKHEVEAYVRLKVEQR